MAKWLVYSKRADFDAVANEFSISPMLARIIRNRELIEYDEIRKFLNGSMEDLYSPYLLKDMENAVALIHKKIKENQRIRVIGDYDVDGICSSYILKTGLNSCGAQIDVASPHRIRDGYGISEALIREAYEDGIDTIITCDNGISASAQIEYAKQLGMTVIITDHHEVPFEDTEAGRRFFVPPADAVIDPKQEDCSYPYSSICGAVVAYKLMEGYLKTFSLQTEILSELLEFACIATVGDVMPLLDENRIIVKNGLKRIMSSGNTGLKALIAVNGLLDKTLTPYHLGFILCPCLNATGRLDTALRALELFDEKDMNRAMQLANELKSLNDSRKDMTQKGVEEACTLLESTTMQQDQVLVLYLPECHESLAGIIAGRIREKYGKPTFVLTDAEEEVKGSGRSIEAFHMYEQMSAHKELFLKYGGHKLAAGLSIEKEKIDLFRKCMNENCQLTDDDFLERIYIDIPMPLKFADMNFVKELATLEPYGIGNPKPVFAQKDIYFVSAKVLGQNANVFKLVMEDETGMRFDGICFGDTALIKEKITMKYGSEEIKNLLDGKKTRLKFSIVYSPEINEFRGNQSIQIVIKDFE